MRWKKNSDGRSIRCGFGRTSSIDGAPAFSELEWTEKEIRLPGLTLRRMKRTGRCAATNVDPKTGARDMQIPRSLVAEYGHEDFGIYLAAKTSGTIAVGDEIEVGRLTSCRHPMA